MFVHVASNSFCDVHLKITYPPLYVQILISETCLYVSLFLITNSSTDDFNVGIILIVVGIEILINPTVVDDKTPKPNSPYVELFLFALFHFQ